ncbi:hypothetical protein CEUSTIGMA_g1498.t1 [Chlamydomonas eustigma]|uniref:Transmembrane protein 17B n=1 Tax=Chlamydomonas eustigma TaxID=1157962 RepID=A0A250WT92_9CHLO|nr:hypothetical protein CEUSTIGMA_g1498.t1 [Chlamydomonas eustigma]|eukprot:GAX74048.1 hypothetical protein CEUSTIGMA_g1498.t1 [Chlamydomonas eustigma]
MLHAGNALEDPRLRNLANRKICSSLFFQQLLYYQVVFDIGWITFWLAWLMSTYLVGLSYKDPKLGRQVVMVIWVIFEPIRMTAGWYGNLQENVPWLILFTIISLVPMQAQGLYMLITESNPYTKSVQFAQIIMLELEMLYGVFVIFRMYRLQKEQFYQFEFVLNQRRRNAAYNTETQLSTHASYSGGGGIGSGGLRRQTHQSHAPP